MRIQDNKLIINTKSFYSYAASIILIYFFFINNFSRVFSFSSVGITVVLSAIGIWGLYALFNGKVRLRVDLFWLCALVIVLISSKAAIGRGDYYWCAMYVTLTLSVFMLTARTEWITGAYKLIGMLAMVHVCATIVLYLFSPTLYSMTLAHFWDELPGGVSINDAYKAGLTSHYSTNGIYCAVAVLICSCKIIASNTRTAKDYVKLLLSIIALLLTTKRAHLLFSICAIIVVYFFFSRGNKVAKVFYILMIGILATMLVYVFAPFVPLIGNVVARFVDQDDISSGRFVFWAQAYQLFLDNMWSGIGWGEYAGVNMYGTGVHNVYIQLLCEAGIPGFVVFILAMGRTALWAIRDCHNHLNQVQLEMRTPFAFAVAFQVFILLYCLTGNCLYDQSVILYYIACAISLSMHKLLKHNTSTPQNK